MWLDLFSFSKFLILVFHSFLFSDVLLSLHTFVPFLPLRLAFFSFMFFFALLLFNNFRQGTLKSLFLLFLQSRRNGFPLLFFKAFRFLSPAFFLCFLFLLHFIFLLRFRNILSLPNFSFVLIFLLFLLNRLYLLLPDPLILGLEDSPIDLHSQQIFLSLNFFKRRCYTPPQLRFLTHNKLPSLELYLNHVDSFKDISPNFFILIFL